MRGERREMIVSVMRLPCPRAIVIAFRRARESIKSESAATMPPPRSAEWPLVWRELLLPRSRLALRQRAALSARSIARPTFSLAIVRAYIERRRQKRRPTNPYSHTNVPRRHINKGALFIRRLPGKRNSDACGQSDTRPMFMHAPKIKTPDSLQRKRRPTAT